MAAKILHSLADDSSDLHKQIGCMTGIFQIFDRQQMISHNKFPGQSHYNDPLNVYHQHPPFDRVLNKSTLNEKQRISFESSSRASFSSSGSSLSSLTTGHLLNRKPLSRNE